MEQLIFFAVIIFFSIIESIARSRKAKTGGQLPEMPPEQEEPAQRPRTRPQQRPRPRPTEVPSYDTDPSFDAEPASDSRGSYDDAKAREALERGRSRSSESMIPAELWDEIAGLAREPARQEPTYTPPARSQPKNVPQPHPDWVRLKLPPTPRRPTAPQKSRAPAKRQPPPAPRRATTLAPEPAPEGVAAHAVHESHVGFGTDPSTRARSKEDGLDPLAQVLGQDASAVHAQLKGGRGPHALRQALILYEVLGPPVSDRPDRF